MYDTLPRTIMQLAAERGESPALRSKVDGSYREISWSGFADAITGYARGLLALGVARGERVAIMMPNCPEWAYADLAAMACGARSVPVYHTVGVATLSQILADSGSRFLFVRTAVAADDLLPQLANLPSLEKIVVLEGRCDDPRCLALEEFLCGGAAVAAEEVARCLAQGGADDVATLVYTSGTTGPPKGAMLSHANLLSNIEAAARLFPIGPEDSCLSFLPLSHVFERMAGYYFMLIRGAVIAYAEHFDAVPANLLEVRPTILISVPRLYEKVYARIHERVLAGPWLRKQLFFVAVRLARKQVHLELSGQRPGVFLAAAVSLLRHVVFAKIRELMGGRLRFFISGGAPLAAEIAEFFLAVGLPIYEGYGLTETSPVLAANTPTAIRPGTVGHPLPGTELRIADDGEILARGPGVFAGYWNHPDWTAEVFAGEWFKTGDIGSIDDAGFVVITDRKKDLIVTAGGENIAPQNLEGLLKGDKYIAGAMVYGDRKPFLTALIVPNFDNLEKFARRHGIAFLNHCDLVNQPQVLALMRRHVDRLQKDLPAYQHIRRFTLLSRDFCGDEMTPTLKLRRRIVRERFHAILDGMYLPQGHGMHDSGFCVVDGPPA